MGIPRRIPYIRLAAPGDLPVLMKIWEDAVSDTHDFLFGPDFVDIKAMMPDYFDRLEVYVQEVL